MSADELCGATYLAAVSDYPPRYCTRERGHAGEHIASIGPYRPGAIVIVRWPAAETEIDERHGPDLGSEDWER